MEATRIQLVEEAIVEVAVQRLPALCRHLHGNFQFRELALIIATMPELGYLLILFRFEVLRAPYPSGPLRTSTSSC